MSRYLNNDLIDGRQEMLKDENVIPCKVYDEANLIGCGGFAEVYKIPGTDKVVKKLKDEFKNNDGIISRFKNEYRLITDTLQGVDGIIKGYSYDESGAAYIMEYCSWTLKEYVLAAKFEEKRQVNLILEILETMRQVHERKVLHRDLSPKNIFIKNGHPIIADFGLGKAFDKNMRTYLTLDTACIGTPEYCDPRQFQSLSFTDEQSDIFSLGMIINYVMTKNSCNFKHFLSSVSKTATQTSLDIRYHNVQEMIDKVKRIDKSKKDVGYIPHCEQLVKSGHYDKLMDEYLFSYEGNDLLTALNDPEFRNVYKSAVSDISNSAVAIERFSALRNIFRSPIGYAFFLFDEVSNFCVDMLKDCKEINSDLKVILGECIYEITVRVTRWEAQSYFDEKYEFLEIEYVRDSIIESQKRRKHR